MLNSSVGELSVKLQRNLQSNYFYDLGRSHSTHVKKTIFAYAGDVLSDRRRESGAAQEMKHQSILIVEDRAETSARLKRAVENTNGIELAGQASTLDQGLSLLFQLKPRVVLVDIGLPDGSGIEIITAIANADWEVDALVISIFGDEARVVQAIQAGARGYILKGSDLTSIGADVLTVIDGGSPISPAIARHVFDKLNGLPEEPSVAQSALTNREAEILQTVARGYTRREIGEQLKISEGTVGNHITSIYRKLKVRSNIEAVAHAAKSGII